MTLMSAIEAVMEQIIDGKPVADTYTETDIRHERNTRVTGSVSVDAKRRFRVWEARI